MKNIFIMNFFLIIVSVSLLGQDNSYRYTICDLGLHNLQTEIYSRSMNYSNPKPDSIDAHNILWKPFDLTTVGVQAVSGIGFAAAGFALGYLTKRKGGDASGLGEGLTILLASTLGAIALPTGVYFSGNWMGGNGGYWSTLGGGIVVGGLAILPIALAGRSDAGGQILVVIAALGGGIAGYNLSASPVYEEKIISSSQIGLLQPNFNINICSIRF